VWTHLPTYLPTYSMQKPHEVPSYHVLVKIKYSYPPNTGGSEATPEPEQKHFFVKATSHGVAIELVRERLIDKNGWDCEYSFTVKDARWLGDAVINNSMPEGSEIYAL
jgi:hypothetical protein